MFRFIKKVVMLTFGSILSLNSMGQSEFNVIDNIVGMYVPHGLGGIYNEWVKWENFNEAEILDSYPASYLNQFYFEGYYHVEEGVGILIQFEKPSLTVDGNYCRSSAFSSVYLPEAINDSSVAASIITQNNAVTLISFDEELLSKECEINNISGFSKFIITEIEDDILLSAFKNNYENLIQECREETRNIGSFWQNEIKVGRIGSSYQFNIGKSSFYFQVLNSQESSGEIRFIFDPEIKFLDCDVGYIN